MSEYELMPLQKKILKERLMYEKDLYNVFRRKKDLTKIIREEIIIRTKNDEEKNWVVIQINGETGSKKSSVALALMKRRIFPSFTAKNVTQEYQEFLDLLNNSVEGEGFVLDEMVFQRGTGTQRMREELLNLVETLRKRRNSMILVTPSEKFISDDNVTFTLEPCGFDKQKKVVRCLVRKGGRYIGFYYEELLWNDELWLAYEKKKDSFLEKTKSQRFGKIDYEKIALEIISSSKEEELSNRKRIKLFIEKHGRNMTVEERDLLTEQVLLLKK